MPEEYSGITEFASRYAATRVATTRDVPNGQCEWCQMHGAVCAVLITWCPRPDVLSDGVAECCAACAESRIQRAVDDAIDGSLVQVELYDGAAA
ncbi:hypothetical protein ABT324_24125 [Saccharopolyspora sp. NPDC000359]|uniref:hypothetical protein n=1 Tax=Saccharopolyspora sp. NPDC000359 TaxID=3154251 RepID=UPI0033236E06